MSMQSNRPFRAFPLPALLCLAIAGHVAAQGRPIAFTNATIHTAAGPALEGATLVIKDGKVEACGKDVDVPAGAKVVDATGKTIMPGLVSAWSRAGLNPPSGPDLRMRGPNRRVVRMRRTPRSTGRASNNAATKIVERIYARQPIFGELLENGVTSLALNPISGGFAGLGAVLDPSGRNLRELTLDDDAFVQISMVRDGATKKMLGETFAKAKQVVEERTKPKEQPKPEPKAEAPKKDEAKPDDANKPGDKPQPKGDEKPKPDDKPQPKPDEKKPEAKPAPEKKAAPKKPTDPNLEVLADLLQGKRRALVEINSATDMLHWRDAVKDDVEFPRTVVVSRYDEYSGTIDLAVDHLKAWKCSVLLPPTLSVKPRTAYLVHPAKTLHDAGIEVAFQVGESPEQVRSLFFNLMNLVRAGLPQDVAIQGVTRMPAKVLGIDKRTGSLEEGKDADLLVFDGDPLSPTGKLEQVWLRGERVGADERP